MLEVWRGRMLLRLRSGYEAILYVKVGHSLDSRYAIKRENLIPYNQE